MHCAIVEMTGVVGKSLASGLHGNITLVCLSLCRLDLRTVDCALHQARQPLAIALTLRSPNLAFIY